jgi:hypothetical protein
MAELFNLSDTDDSNTARFPEGMLGANINNGARALEGMLARDYHDRDGSRTSTGSSNAYLVGPARTTGGLFNNLVQVFTANHTNTGAATLQLTSASAKAIRRPNGDALEAGDIVSGQVVVVVYKSSPDYWQMLSPYSGAASDINIPARAYQEYTTNTSITGIIDRDDSLPQNTEGTEILSLSITLKRSDSRVRLRFQGWGTYLSTPADDCVPWVAALFGSGADALRAALSGPAGNNTVSAGDSPPTTCAVLEFEHAPGSVGPHTYTVRVGKQGSGGSAITTGTFRMNGNTSTRWFGGAAAATLVAEEVFV